MAHLESLKGKTILITGANAGLGLASTKILAKQGAATIYMQGRSLDKLQSAIQLLQSDTSLSGTTFTPLVADLADLASVSKLADEITATISHLDILILNAGIFGTKYQLTKDGIEQQFQVNHLSQFLLVQKLVPLLTKSKTRVTLVSSSAAAGSLKLSLDKVNDPATYDSYKDYGISKLCNLHTMLYLSKTLGNFTAADPGPVKTEIQGKADGNGFIPSIAKYIGWMFASPEDGAKSQCVAAAGVGVENGTAWHKNGKRWDITKIVKPEDTDKLYEFSVSLLKEKGFLAA